MQKYIFAFFLFLCCVSDITYAQGNLNGIVIDRDTNAPLAFATVSTKDTTVICDAQGQFNIPNYTYSPFHVTYLGYAQESQMPTVFIETPSYDQSVTIYMYSTMQALQLVSVIALRADEGMPVTLTNIHGATLQKNNFGEDLPMLLEALPSAVATSDAGNGVGYTGLRIRGSDATRVNITINGVPYNDAESQQTYWVDLPDFASSVDDIQVQRGVGSSTNGVSAFGASVNIHTNNLSELASLSVQAATGSFGLRKGMINYQSGRFADHWFVEYRISDVYSDGFIDRGFADLQSQFFTLGYKGRITSIVNVFTGSELTYQSWGGVPAEVIDTNRTYNPYTYENQVDDYTQTHMQWHNMFSTLKGEWRLTLNHTIGNGFYEQLESDQDFSDYGVSYPVYGADTIFYTDLITQKWLDNQFTGAFLQYKHKGWFFHDWTSGAAVYRYAGDHFGKVIWSEFAEPFGHDHNWYANDALKYDANVFTQLHKRIFNYQFYLDLQVRHVQYTFEGYDAFGDLVDQQVDYQFFNPKFGVLYKHMRNSEAYVYFGRSVKEPNRNDFVESTPLSRPSPEKLYNLELGERFVHKGWQILANYYLMYYVDQLVLTGELNDVGAYTRTNVPESYRTGIELALSRTFLERIRWNANATWSKNVITAYTEYVDDWDTGGQIPYQYSGTSIAFSPEWIAYNQFSITCLSKPLQNASAGHTLVLDLTGKYVGEQFLDNSSDPARKLEAYYLQDIGLRYTLQTRVISAFELSFLLQNALDAEYESNGWVYRYRYEGLDQQLLGYYPQAGRNWVLMARFTL